MFKVVKCPANFERIEEDERGRQIRDHLENLFEKPYETIKEITEKIHGDCYFTPRLTIPKEISVSLSDDFPIVNEWPVLYETFMKFKVARIEHYENGKPENKV